ncbi:IS3 family transposase [Streptococcus suis]|nr:IS3 family transposase [Streptococcus suis]
MTIRLSDLGQVYLVCGKTDMRQGIDSLAYLVKSQFNLDPFSGQVYLFEYIFYYNNKRIKTKLKGLSPVQYRTKSFQ